MHILTTDEQGALCDAFFLIERLVRDAADEAEKAKAVKCLGVIHTILQEDHRMKRA